MTLEALFLNRAKTFYMIFGFFLIYRAFKLKPRKTQALYDKSEITIRSNKRKNKDNDSSGYSEYL